MKTLSEVIDQVKDGGKPEYDELRYAVVALSALHHFSFNKLLDLAAKEREGKYNNNFGLQYWAEERFKGFKAALGMTPKDYVGPSHDPDGEEAQRWRRISNKILNHVLNKNEHPSKTSSQATQ